MDNAISERIGEKPPSKVLILDLNSCGPIDLKKLEPFTNVKNISLSNTGLSCLDEFPALESIVVLDLSNNNLSTGFQSLCLCKSLVYLNLSNNPIKNIEEIKCLSSLNYLQAIKLLNCPVAEINGFREKIFKIFPNLSVLNGKDVDGKDIPSSDDDIRPSTLLRNNSSGEYDSDLSTSENEVDDEEEDYEEDEDDDDDEEENDEPSDTRLEVLLGDDIPSEMDDSEFQLDESTIKHSESLNSDSVIVENSDEENQSNKEIDISTNSNSVSHDNIEKRPIPNDPMPHPSPSKKPKV